MANSTLNQWIKTAVDAYNAKPKKENTSGKGIPPITKRLEKWNESPEVMKLAEELADNMADTPEGREAIRLISAVMPKDKAPAVKVDENAIFASKLEQAMAALKASGKKNPTIADVLEWQKKQAG